MAKIEIEIPDGKKAEWVNGVLTLVDIKPEDIKERIKTFDDACYELGCNHPLVREWSLGENLPPDLAAYLKLRIICAALNEGWTPKFTEDEWRYYPCFTLYTADKLSKKSEVWKRDRALLDITGDYVSEYVGLTCEYSLDSSSNETTFYSSRLCCKNSGLSTYFGKQFIRIWADYLLIRK